MGYPYGAERWTSGTLPTDYRFTGQREEANLGLYHMGARFYDPALGRWLSPDVIVPGAAASSGGGAATLGYDDQVRLTPLTVGFHETQFLSVVGEENREIAAKGFWFQRSEEEKGKSKYQWGPSNPQALNRYSYCLGNPLRYVDPAGHDQIDVQLTAEEVRDLLAELDWWLDKADSAEDIVIFLDATGLALELLALLGIAASLSAPAGGALLLTGAVLTWTAGDLQELRYQLAMASGGGKEGVLLTMRSNLVKWGIEINGNEVISHLNFTPKGKLNLTIAWLAAWYYFDLRYQPPAYGPKRKWPTR